MDTKIRIAVISDTHNEVPKLLPERLSEADEIWHLGDVCYPDILLPIEALGKPMSIVKGNMDPFGPWPDHLLLERGGFRFRLQHLPPKDSDGDSDAILFGHLHCPSQDDWNGQRILNPGAITGPRQGSQSSFAWITLNENRDWTWETRPLA